MCLGPVRRRGIRGDPGLLPRVYNLVAITKLLTVKWGRSETVSMIDAL